MLQNDWHDQKTYDSLISYGGSAIKYVFFINGGAILALLTFLGTQESGIVGFGYIMPLFVLGIICGGTASLCAYFTQLYLFNDNEEAYLKYQKGAIAAIIAGFVLFLVGALPASYVLTP